MICSNCGQEMGDGAFCVSCGMPAQQPQQQMGYGQPQQPQQQMGYGQPQQQMNRPQVNLGQAVDVNGFVKSLDVFKIVGLVGAFFMLISPFLSWWSIKISYSLWGASTNSKEAGNLFKLEGIYFLFALVIMLLAVLSVIVIALDFIPVIKSKVPAKLFSIIGIITPAAATVINVLIFILVAINFNKIDDDYLNMGSVNTSHGVGPIFLLLACVAVAAPAVMPMINKKKY